MGVALVMGVLGLIVGGPLLGVGIWQMSVGNAKIKEAEALMVNEGPGPKKPRLSCPRYSTCTLEEVEDRSKFPSYTMMRDATHTKDFGVLMLLMGSVFLAGSLIGFGLAMVMLVKGRQSEP